MASRHGGNGKESDATGLSAASRFAATVSAPLYLDIPLGGVKAP